MSSTRDEEWLPDDVDFDTPSAARLYDYYLGGRHNFAPDRELAHRIYQVFPEMPALARENRAFLRRAVRHLLRRGVRQFVDIGCGLPTAGAVHEIALQSDPEARVVYVDNEPVAVAHSDLLLRDETRATVFRGDLRAPDAILRGPRTRELLDLDQPVAVLMVAVLHFVGDDEQPLRLLQDYRQLLNPQDYLVVSHASGDTLPSASGAAELYRNSQNSAHLRSHAEIRELLADYTLHEPGLVFLPEWQPDHPADAEHAASCSFYGALAQP